MIPGQPGYSHGPFGHGHAAHQAERERKRRRAEEEELMTGYRPDELSGDWQFKIVKGTFKTAKQIQAVQDEMAGWGWTLVEVFDERRIRFKRPAIEASKDSDREGNPFRMTSNASAPGCATAAAMLLLIGVVVVWMA